VNNLILANLNKINVNSHTSILPKFSLASFQPGSMSAGGNANQRTKQDPARPFDSRVNNTARVTVQKIVSERARAESSNCLLSVLPHTEADLTEAAYTGVPIGGCPVNEISKIVQKAGDAFGCVCSYIDRGRQNYTVLVPRTNVVDMVDRLGAKHHPRRVRSPTPMPPSAQVIKTERPEKPYVSANMIPVILIVVLGLICLLSWLLYHWFASAG